LNETREVAVVTLVGRLFHARAAITRKDRSPMVLSHVLGTIRRCSEPDRSRHSDSASSVHWWSRRRYGVSIYYHYQPGVACSLTTGRLSWHILLLLMVWQPRHQSLTVQVLSQKNSKIS